MIAQKNQELMNKHCKSCDIYLVGIIVSRGFDDDSKRHETLPVPETDQEYLEILSNKFGFNEFFKGQLEAIKSILHNKSCLSIMSTGGGKSLIYQYCSLFMKGVVVVVTPLLSLMNVSNLIN